MAFAGACASLFKVSDGVGAVSGCATTAGGGLDLTVGVGAASAFSGLAAMKYFQPKYAPPKTTTAASTTSGNFELFRGKTIGGALFPATFTPPTAGGFGGGNGAPPFSVIGGAITGNGGGAFDPGTGGGADLIGGGAPTTAAASSGGTALTGGAPAGEPAVGVSTGRGAFGFSLNIFESTADGAVGAAGDSKAGGAAGESEAKRGAGAGGVANAAGAGAATCGFAIVGG